MGLLEICGGYKVSFAIDANLTWRADNGHAAIAWHTLYLMRRIVMARFEITRCARGLVVP